MNIATMNLRVPLSVLICAFGLSLTGCAGAPDVADGQDGPADEAEGALKQSANDKGRSAAVALDGKDDPSVAQERVLAGDLEAQGEHPSEQEPTNNLLGGYGPQLIVSGTFNYSGGLGGASYNTIVGDWCPNDYVRDYAQAYTYTGSGSCSVVGWVSDDVQDCRIRVHVGIPNFWKSGSCFWGAYGEQLFYQDYGASNTNNAQQNTMDTPLPLSAGQTITVGTCGVPGVRVNWGDTYLRLVNSNGQTVALNDDACGGLSSNMVYTVPSSGTYVIKAGCYSSGSCSARLGYFVR